MPTPCSRRWYKLVQRARHARGGVRQAMSSAAAETKDTVAALGEKYKYGFVTDIEMERAPKGLSKTRCATSRPRRASRTGCWNGGWAPSAAGAR